MVLVRKNIYEQTQKSSYEKKCIDSQKSFLFFGEYKNNATFIL